MPNPLSISPTISSGPEIDVVEEQLPLGFRRRNTDRNVLFLESLRLQVDDEQRKAVGLLPGFALRRGPRHHQRMVGAVGVGDERLLAVEGEAVAALLRHRHGADGVASGVGLGDRKAEPGLALAGIGQIARLLLLRAVFGDEAEAHGGADHEIEQRNAVVRQPLEKQVHLDHALAGAAILFGDHGADEPVVGDPLVQRLGKDVLFGALHPVFAIEFLRDQIAIFQDLPLLVRKIKVHASAPSPPALRSSMAVSCCRICPRTKRPRRHHRLPSLGRRLRQFNLTIVRNRTIVRKQSAQAICGGQALRHVTPSPASSQAIAAARVMTNPWRAGLRARGAEPCRWWSGEIPRSR